MKGNSKDIVETLERSYESKDWSGIQLLITCLKVIWGKWWGPAIEDKT